MSVEPTDGTFLIFGQLWYVDVITITSLFSYKCNVGLPDKWLMQKKWNLYAPPWFYRPPNLVWPGNPPPPQKKKRKRKRVFFQYPLIFHLLKRWFQSINNLLYNGGLSKLAVFAPRTRIENNFKDFVKVQFYFHQFPKVVINPCAMCKIHWTMFEKQRAQVGFSFFYSPCTV